MWWRRREADETGLWWQQKLLKSWRCWSWCGSGRVISMSAVTQLLFVLGSIDSCRLVCGGSTGMLLKAFLRFLGALEAKHSYHKRWPSLTCLFVSYTYGVHSHVEMSLLLGLKAFLVFKMVDTYSDADSTRQSVWMTKTLHLQQIWFCIL